MSDGGPVGRFWKWLRGGNDPAELRPAPKRDSEEPIVLRSQDETWLVKLMAQVLEGKRTGEVGGDEFWQHVRGLWREGHEKLAVEWLEKFIEIDESPEEIDTELRAKLVELLEERGDLGPGVVHLQKLTAAPEHATRAHFLLAEHYRRRGEEVAALRHYEAVIARDVDYPNARIRLERLRQKRGRAAPGSQATTIAGGDALGVGSGARYHLVRELGRGATAVVYLGRDTELERDVAVKLLHPHLAAADQRHACTRFFNEARLAASLRHPNIVAILDMGEEARRLVMELAAGGTLRALLSEGGAMELTTALERHVQLLSALAVAHDRGIVHRDVKPGNLMFRRDPAEPGVEIMLGDFGVANLPEGQARTRDETAAEARVRGQAVGTLGYMPPEQRRGGEVTGKVDVYAAAVVLYEMLAGRHPLSRTAVLEGKRRPGDFALPAELAAKLGAELAATIQEHLDWLSHPDADERPDSDRGLEAATGLWLASAEATA
ncbi:MAG: serine/threonine protein kinase [Deltaproteobacteria bacterium]|nr:serine/threonine protein kinase [Deltaproteobacteria bacterium]